MAVMNQMGHKTYILMRVSQRWIFQYICVSVRLDWQQGVNGLTGCRGSRPPTTCPPQGRRHFPAGSLELQAEESVRQQMADRSSNREFLKSHREHATENTPQGTPYCPLAYITATQVNKHIYYWYYTYYSNIYRHHPERQLPYRHHFNFPHTSKCCSLAVTTPPSPAAVPCRITEIKGPTLCWSVWVFLKHDVLLCGRDTIQSFCVWS